MGGTPSRVGRKVSRTWNVENRAQKVLEKRQKDPDALVQSAAPKHESTRQILEDFQKENPQYLEAQKFKNESLHDRLKGMEVVPDKVHEVGRRKLPDDRESRFVPEFGYLEPSSLPMGKCSMRQVLKFIDNHQQNPEQVTAEDIASEYTLDAERVKNILKYYKMFEVQIPGEERKSEKMSLSSFVGRAMLPAGSKDPSDKGTA